VPTHLLEQLERSSLPGAAEYGRTASVQPDHFRACGISAKGIEYIAPAFLPECFFFEAPPRFEPFG
jgi:hypothetical protein